MVLVTPYTPTEKRGRTEIPKIFKGKSKLTLKEITLTA